MKMYKTTKTCKKSRNDIKREIDSLKNQNKEYEVFINAQNKEVEDIHVKHKKQIEEQEQKYEEQIEEFHEHINKLMLKEDAAEKEKQMQEQKNIKNNKKDEETSAAITQELQFTIKTLEKELQARRNATTTQMEDFNIDIETKHINKIFYLHSQIRMLQLKIKN